MIPTFPNRREAGRQLGARLKEFSERPGLLVLGLPRGGVPVAAEVARALDAPLDVFVVRKLGVPGHEELAMGAIASGGVRVLNPDVVRVLGIPDRVIDQVARRERRELERRERALRTDHPRLDIRNRTILLVDDGLATGSTMRAAVCALRTQHPREIIVAVPTASPTVRDEFARLADACISLITPEPFYAVGLWYDDFSQTSDAEVNALLEEAHRVPATDPVS